ncbi:AraC family transcriptional regulator [Vibrio fluvialis]|uniref:AraC family transcriptional regulator n=1 Tax=Vibrio fluvialis TaxID=676 RepID=UPI001F38B226|nr:AraC family transcriptional regulator [Vibrio fluvialis]MCE7646749.1 AraC family transcriptional regulator [Vibrio fluvialis]
MNQQHVSRINDILYYIHQDITNDLSAKHLADLAAYSEQHFHRVFKQVVGESIHQYIRRTRMEYAANQLMFDGNASVIDIANKCGFSSLSSFSKAFKATFHMAPGNWRHGEQHLDSKPYLKDPEVAAGYNRVTNLDLPTPKIVETKERIAAYVRHQGYNRSIRRAWLVLKAWAKEEGRTFEQLFGLHHSNPAWVELDKCRYVACLEIDEPLKVRGVVNQMTIPGGLHAVFRLRGVYGELLPQVSKIFEKWLPNSGYKLRSTPAYVHYHKNHFLNEDERFEIDFYLPISFF